MEVELGWNKDHKGTPYVQRMEKSWRNVEYMEETYSYNI
jgi:hypothetical protein